MQVRAALGYWGPYKGWHRRSPGKHLLWGGGVQLPLHLLASTAGPTRGSEPSVPSLDAPRPSPRWGSRVASRPRSHGVSQDPSMDQPQSPPGRHGGGGRRYVCPIYASDPGCQSRTRSPGGVSATFSSRHIEMNFHVYKTMNY